MKLNRLLLYGIIIALFFEARQFSFLVLGARIRSAQVLACAAIPLVLVGFLCKKWAFQKTRLDLFLWSYLGINGLAILNSRDAHRSVKIALLLFSLALLYYLVIYLAFTMEIFSRAFNLLVWVGIGEIVFGLYQVAAGVSNFALKTRLPIYPAGILQQKYLSSPWGRPYGTFVEPDWYGAICAFYALFFFVLLFSDRKRKCLPAAGLILSLAGLFLSFVRAAWLGFVFGLVWLVLFRKRSFRFGFHPARLARLALFFLVAILVLVLLFPQLRTVLLKRFLPPENERLTTLGIRFVNMKLSFQSFLESPLIGHGPGTPISQKVQFNPSLITTLLDDTGILGFSAFALFLFSLFRMAWKKLPNLEVRFQPLSLGLFAGLAGLFFSYIFTTGLWLPLTWAFMGLAVASLNVGTLPTAASETARVGTQEPG